MNMKHWYAIVYVHLHLLISLNIIKYVNCNELGKHKWHNAEGHNWIELKLTASNNLVLKIYSCTILKIWFSLR